MDQFCEDRGLHYREVLSIALSFRFSKHVLQLFDPHKFFFHFDFPIDVTLFAGSRQAFYIASLRLETSGWLLS